ncbi:hypothetical protein VZT92_023821 [Zoarces viviparus]|uniref:Uncharacterized protein n=1 Tax=Zoarces viviparus TaxID=48416 RepID=A0AAW1E887_ZOAVI
MRRSIVQELPTETSVPQRPPSHSDLRPTETSVPQRPLTNPPPFHSVRKPKSRPTPPHADVRAEPGQTPTAPPASARFPRPTTSSWEEAGLSPPSSVWVRPQTPTMRGAGSTKYPSKKRLKNNGRELLQKCEKTRKDTYAEDTINGRNESG